VSETKTTVFHPAGAGSLSLGGANEWMAQRKLHATCNVAYLVEPTVQMSFINILAYDDDPYRSFDHQHSLRTTLHLNFAGWVHNITHCILFLQILLKICINQNHHKRTSQVTNKE
jgi:hypothetical protein